MKGFDTHIHTTYSDGIYDPATAAKIAEMSNLTGMAITDHDTVGALETVAKLCAKRCFPIIPGIELSAEYEGTDVHVLGYFIDRNNTVLKDRLAELCLSRRKRLERMCELLCEHDMPMDYYDLEVRPWQTPGRPMVARAMVAKNYVKNEKEAFTKWIGRGMSCYVDNPRLDPFEAMDLITGAGGVPCLAHPGIDVPMELIERMIAYGLQGIEVYHPEHSLQDEFLFGNLARKHDLIILGGSDFHGDDSRPMGLKFTPLDQVKLLYKKAGKDI